MTHERLNVPESERYVVNPLTGCWIWLGTIDKEGYGRATEGVAHRYMYRLSRGTIPAGLVLDHLCVRRNCVNPDHLEAVTVAENLVRSRAYLRPASWAKTACSRGHEYTEENTYTRISTRRGKPETIRQCKTCNNTRRRERRSETAACKGD